MSLVQVLILLGHLSFSPSTSPDIVVITVDTLRADRMGYYGYSKQTTPHLDQLLEQGAVFTNARTPEPLTAPALISMLTSQYPHQHGATRNGLPHRSGLDSLTRQLKERGYQTTAMVSNWTLKDRLTGISEHFHEYHEIMEKRRWLGLFLSEADAADLTDRGIDWLKKQPKDKPFFLWIHYADPHAPYKLHEPFAKKLGIKGEANRSHRYDTEVAFTDHHIGRLLEHIPEDALIVFASDHGESLGEHDYWGHGRHLYEPTLKIPLAFIWKGKIPAMKVDHPAILMDIAPTLLGLLKVPRPEAFEGYNWTDVFLGERTAPPSRTTFYQAHKGAVQTKAGARNGRLNGLLELAVITDNQKEIYRIRSRSRKIFELTNDNAEIKSLCSKRSEVSVTLRKWAVAVEKGLRNISSKSTELNESDVEMLKSLGYID